MIFRKVTADGLSDEALHRNILLVFVGLTPVMLLASLDQIPVFTVLPTIFGELDGVEYMLWGITSHRMAPHHHPADLREDGRPDRAQGHHRGCHLPVHRWLDGGRLRAGDELTDRRARHPGPRWSAAYS